ncbi:MAG: flagellar hook-basal body protein [Candidatus Zixiibacteriota bacterium]
MIKGIFNSASAMVPRVKQQEAIANNLANVSTPGFKKDGVFVRELSDAQARRLPGKSDWERPMIDQVYTDSQQGSFDRTGNPLDVAIEGAGFFVARAEDGVETLMRNGSFSADELGFLITANGDMILGSGGAIQIPPGDIAIADDGVISVDGEEVSRLRVVTVEDPRELKKGDAGKYHLPDGVTAQDAVSYVIRQGFLESSNVNAITQMVEMIASYRAYEADSQALKSQDESLERLIGEVGRTQ